MPNRLRTLIVDDSAVMRRGIRTLLELDDGIEVVGEAGDGDAALAMAAQTSPDIVLLDVRMPRRDGLSIVAELTRTARVLMLTFSDESHVVREAMAAGATGYLVHGTFDADSLAATVRSSASGMAALSGPALTAMMAGDQPAAGPRPGKASAWGLSVRQAEVMDLISQGRSNREIARELFLTEKTVKNHINQIFMKLSASNRGQAIATWLGTGPGTQP
ncbi:MAG: response regulator transcription factor [Propioniciclava sp.]|uniref:response regulator n=1 Tax=Propioniciclava sp. TaxID=2038686 RepID=UPI0039E321A5